MLVYATLNLIFHEWQIALSRGKQIYLRSTSISIHMAMYECPCKILLAFSHRPIRPVAV